MKIFETHAHYDDEAFDGDREELIDSFAKNGVCKVCNIGASLKGCKATVDLIDRYDFFYGAIGVHPSDILAESELENTVSMLRNWSRDRERIVAIGEIGLDYHYDSCDENVKLLQKKWFVRQLDLARELKKPVVIHSRDAAADTMEIMKAEDAASVGGVVHCYSYSPEIARQYVDMGFFIGVGGVLTFKNSKKLKDTVREIPLEKIVLETDSPYLAPEPYRGKRNSSLYIPYVVESIAQIKGISEDDVYEQTWINAHKLYKIDL